MHGKKGRNATAQRKYFDTQKVSRKTDENHLYDRVKAPLTVSVYYQNHLPPLAHPILSNNTASRPSLSTNRLHPTPP